MCPAYSSVCHLFDEGKTTASVWLHIHHGYRIFSYISRGIYPRTKYYTDNSSYTRVTPSGKKLYRKQVEIRTRQW